METLKNEPVRIAEAVVTIAAIFAVDADVEVVASVVAALVLIFETVRRFVTPAAKAV